MERVYALGDRRCRTHTALDQLATLRLRLQRFTQVGDTLLPSTSNAVERGNRRYRTMQKHVYRVRTHEQNSARLALDMWREAQAAGRQHTRAALHHARAG